MSNIQQNPCFDFSQALLQLATGVPIFLFKGHVKLAVISIKMEVDVMFSKDRTQKKQIEGEEKGRGPRIERWGTPHVRGAEWDSSAPMQTEKHLPVK